jgi:hypothetical protein
MSDAGGNTNVQSILRNPEPIMEYTPIAQSAPGRVCAEAGCGTILSIYNHSEFCDLHQPADSDTLPDGYRECSRCRTVLPLSAFKAKSKEKDGVVYYWTTRLCTRCLAQERAASRDRGRQRDVAKERQRKADYYYQKTYGQPNKAAYLAAKRAEGAAMLARAMEEVKR